MEPSPCLRDYIANPIGRYTLGPTYLVWCKTTKLRGMVFWGRPEPEHMASVTRAIDVDGGPRASLVDARRVESVVPEAFDTLAAYVRSRADKLRYRVYAQALLRPDGLVGATVAGFCRFSRSSTGCFSRMFVMGRTQFSGLGDTLIGEGAVA